MPTLQLPDEDARIVALAVAYHLGRPGSEVDPDTLRRHEIGLASVERTLTPQLGSAHVEIEVSPYQLHRIDEGLLGVTNELKAYEMADRRSVVSGFEAALARLFPALAEDAPDRADDAETALDLVERVVLLRRRLAGAVRGAEAAIAAEREAATRAAAEARRAQRPWWRFWG
jgi:hypothetical protein